MDKDDPLKRLTGAVLHNVSELVIDCVFSCASLVKSVDEPPVSISNDAKASLHRDMTNELTNIWQKFITRLAIYYSITPIIYDFPLNLCRITGSFNVQRIEKYLFPSIVNSTGKIVTSVVAVVGRVIVSKTLGIFSGSLPGNFEKGVKMFGIILFEVPIKTRKMLHISLDNEELDLISYYCISYSIFMYNLRIFEKSIIEKDNFVENMVNSIKKSKSGINWKMKEKNKSKEWCESIVSKMDSL